MNYKGLANGVSPDMLGTTDKMSDHQFAALLLRGAGYSDAKGDFVWNQAMDKAVEVGLITRGEMIILA